MFYSSYLIQGKICQKEWSFAWYVRFLPLSLGKWIKIEGIQGKLYHFSQERITFAKAKATCKHNEGKLFEPTTEAINNRIAAIARDKGIKNPWIGIHHVHNENRTVFASTNTTIEWSNWDDNEPNNENNIEECTHLYNGRTENSCELEWVGDGYCDDKHNKEECGWDGGDCCDDESVDRGENAESCSACQCLEPFRWNDDNCNELKKFICERDGTGK